MTPETDITSADTEQAAPSAGQSDQAPHGAISGDRIQIHQGSAQTVQGKFVEIHQGGAQFVEGEQVSIQRGGAMTIRADQVTLSESGAVVVSADHASFDDHSRAGVVIANRIDCPEVRSSLVLAREIHGNVETRLDSRGALLIGLGMGLGISLLASLKSLFRSEDS